MVELSLTGTVEETSNASPGPRSLLLFSLFWAFDPKPADRNKLHELNKILYYK